MWVERRRGRSEGSVGAWGLGGGEEEKMSERVLLGGLVVVVGVVGEGEREGGVVGGVDDILGLEELGGLFSLDVWVWIIIVDMDYSG